MGRARSGLENKKCHRSCGQFYLTIFFSSMDKKTTIRSPTNSRFESPFESSWNFLLGIKLRKVLDCESINGNTSGAGFGEEIKIIVQEGGIDNKPKGLLRQHIRGWGAGEIKEDSKVKELSNWARRILQMMTCLGPWPKLINCMGLPIIIKWCWDVKL